MPVVGYSLWLSISVKLTGMKTEVPG